MTLETTAPPMTHEHPRTGDEIATILADAHATRTPLRIVGSGGWLDANRPVTANRAVSMRECAGIIEYVPGDLVITVAAGTTLAEVAHATAPHGQWLTLDPIGRDSGTIGATVATASFGPLALGVGTVRDLVLGVRAVTGTGRMLRVGGRVVKNVAGFDLVRLHAGAYGTLGVLAEISLRLHAKPARDDTYVVELADHSPSALSASLGHRALSFQALELLDPAAAERVGIVGRSPWTAVIRVMGNASRVSAQRDALAALGSVHVSDPNVWTTLRDEAADCAALRVTDAPAKLDATVRHVRQALHSAQIGNAELRIAPHRGSARVVLPRVMSARGAPSDGHANAVSVSSIGAVLESLRSSANSLRIIAERLPVAAWSFVPPATVDPISQRIRDAFDPQRILNRGIFGETAP